MISTKITSFKDLETWREAHKLVLMIYEMTQVFPNYEMFGMTQQIRRAAVSVSSNIAEGFSRFTPKDKTRFYFIARGSLTEIENQLIISKDIGYITDNVFTSLTEQITIVNKLLYGMIRYARS
jgi:four helix bundle protein